MSNKPQSPDKGFKKGPLAYMTGHSVAANLLMLFFLIGGLIYGAQIKQEVFPDFDLDYVTVSVAYPGASPEEVEQGIVLVVEEAVQGLDGVKEVTSTAREGVGAVTVEALRGTNMQRLAADIQSEVDRIISFPKEAEQPVVSIISHRRGVISVVLYGDQDPRVLRDKAEEIRDTLLQDPGITQVDLSGVRNLEISIEVPQENLRAYGLTLAQVAARVRAASVDLPGGGIKTKGGEILVRMTERRDYGRQFARIPIITTNSGTEVLLGDIAKVKDGFEDSDAEATYNGQPAVMIDVYRVGRQTPIGVSDAVRAQVAALKADLPHGLHLATMNDMSEIYRQRLDLLLTNGYLGLGLVFLLLGLFLEIRLAFWVTMGIPTSFLGSLLILPALGVSINMISMFAFITALGIVVDDAIVVGENIYHRRQDGMGFMAAAVLGVREVAMPVIFAVLTNIVTFMPLFFVPGTMGKIFKAIPVVVVLVFLISLVECLFILPAHLGHQKERHRRGPARWLYNGQQAFPRGFTRLVWNVYRPLLGFIIRNRYLTMACGVGLLMVTLAFVMSGRMGLTLFPRVESDYAYAKVVLPYGSSVDRTRDVQNRLIKAAEKVAQVHGGRKLVEGIFAHIGGSSARGGATGGHIDEVRVFLVPPDVRPLPTAEFVKLWRQAVGPVAGVESLIFRSDQGGPGSGAAITVELSHRDLKVLEKAGADLAEELGRFSRVKDIDDGFSPGKEQLDFTVRPEGLSLGLTANEVAGQVRHAFYGAEVARQQRGRNEVKIMVRLPKAERISEYDLEEMILLTPKGAQVPLREAVDVKRGRAYTNISRRAGRRVITVSADIDPPSDAGRVLKSLEASALPKLLNRYPGLHYGYEGRQADMNESLDSLQQGLILAMLAIYALLAIPLKSYWQPAIIMSAIPFGMVGAVGGHLLMGYSLSLMSMFGIVALSGVVVNDSLVLIDFANRRRAEGAEATEAITSAGVARFRAIILTTLTTFGGLTPMILETSRQARFLIPMALSLGFGVLFATVITLALVPSLYMILDDFQRLFAPRPEPLELTETAEPPGRVEGPKVD